MQTDCAELLSSVSDVQYGKFNIYKMQAITNMVTGICQKL